MKKYSLQEFENLNYGDWLGDVISAFYKNTLELPENKEIGLWIDAFEILKGEFYTDSKKLKDCIISIEICFNHNQMGIVIRSDKSSITIKFLRYNNKYESQEDAVYSAKDIDRIYDYLETTASIKRSIIFVIDSNDVGSPFYEVYSDNIYRITGKENWINDYQDISLVDKLNEQCIKYNITSDADLSRKSRVNDSTVGKIRNGKVKSPKREILFSLGLGMHLSLVDISDLLATAGYCFLKNSPIECYIRYCFETGYYDIDEIEAKIEDMVQLKCNSTYLGSGDYKIS